MIIVYYSVILLLYQVIIVDYSRNCNSFFELYNSIKLQSSLQTLSGIFDLTM